MNKYNEYQVYVYILHFTYRIQKQHTIWHQLKGNITTKHCLIWHQLKGNIKTKHCFHFYCEKYAVFPPNMSYLSVVNTNMILRKCVLVM